MSPPDRRSTPARPNILLVNCDDLGYGDLGCYGSTRNDTPHLDRLASDGVRFTDFYAAAPVCSASRAAMLTGCYSQRIGLGDYQVLFPGQAQGLNPSECTIARRLQQAGYATRIIGKWHCGDQPEFLPTRHGFDGYFGIPYSNDMGRQANRPDAPPLPLLRDSEVIQAQPDQRGLTERYVEDAIRFLRDHREGPFFLYLAHLYVHVPLFIPKPFLAASRNGAYGGAVACIDWAMGALDAELVRLGLREKTLVVFTSDNGSRARDEGGSNAPLRGVKAQTWEGGQRVPCLMRWPGVIASGTTCSGIASAIDLFATLGDFSGAPQPPDAKRDSLSLAETLRNGKPSPRDRFAFYRGSNLEALRLEDWKLHFFKAEWKPASGDSPVPEALFNLRDDPGETTNLLAAHPRQAAAIREAADLFRHTLGDARLGYAGTEIRAAGVCPNPKTLTQYNPTHPYFIASYDLADMPTLCG